MSVFCKREGLIVDIDQIWQTSHHTNGIVLCFKLFYLFILLNFLKCPPYRYFCRVIALDSNYVYIFACTFLLVNELIND
jgi:hypothetical protein